MSKRPEPAFSDSMDEYEEARLKEGLTVCGETGCEVVKRACRLGAVGAGTPLGSSERDKGDDKAGDERYPSSKSDACPSTDAAKLLEISVSDTTAKEDCVDAVEVVDVVRSRAENLDARGSNCHVELDTSKLP